MFFFFEDCIQLIQAIAWPAVAVFAIVIFKNDFKKVLSRLKQAKIFGGNEFELGAEVTKLEKNVEQERHEVSEMVFSMEENKKKSIQQDVDEIFKAARIKPPLGVMQLSSILEREVRFLAVNFLGHQHLNLKRPFLELCKILISGNCFPSHIAESLEAFWKIRNEIVHGAMLKDMMKTL